MTNMLICVVIITYGRGQEALGLAESVRAEIERIPAVELGAVVVCDNARELSPLDLYDRTAELMSLENIGYAGAVNAALSRFEADRYVLLTHEVVLESGALGLLIKHSEGHELGVWAPLLTHASVDGSIFSAGLRVNVGRANVRHIVGPVSEERPYRVDGADGAALLFTRETWVRVGRMDESYFLYWEDVDWQIRATGVGVPIYVVPKARVCSGASGNIPMRTYYLARNRIRFAAKHLPIWRLALVCLSCILRSLGSVALAIGRDEVHRRRAVVRLWATMDGLLGSAGPAWCSPRWNRLRKHLLGHGSAESAASRPRSAGPNSQS